METLEVIKKRRSVRQFKDLPVEKEKIEQIIDCARLAPSANNFQPWEFIVVTDHIKRKEIANTTDYGRFIAHSPVCIAVFCRNTYFYLEDGCAATENILIAARALGLGSCWIAGDKTPYASQVAKILGVPDSHRLVSLIALGYPEVEPSPPRKRILEEVLHWDKF
ncbi:MAG: hypothetical protein PWP57_880 [Candidatus Atribacteria bacterium]|nr:hypothetical protein [Candidatus Atribacteria bacterium]